MTTSATIFVVDDDPGVLKSLGLVLRASHFAVRLYDSAQVFLDHYDTSLPGCVICDLAMPGIDGLELQRKLLERGGLHPVIFISGHGSVLGSVKALKQGAVDFLTKPLSEEVLLPAVDHALERDAKLRELRARIAELTGREYEVLERITAGQLNKQIALELGVAERTIKFHRRNLMRKLALTSIAQVVRLAIAAGLIPPMLAPVLQKPVTAPVHE
jgi:FixJ family two-component response regulator